MNTKNYSAIYILKRLMTNHIRPYRSRILLAIFFMIIVASCTASIVKLVKPVIDKVFLSRDKQMLVSLPLMMIGIYTLKGIAEYFQSYLIKYVGQKILTDLQMCMYEHLLHADLSVIQSFSSGRLISRFTNDVSLMRGAVSNLLVGCAKHFLSIVFLIFVMFKLEPVLSAVVSIAFPIAIYPVQKLGRNIRKILSLSQEELSNYTAKLDETFQSVKIVKSFCAEKYEVESARTIINKLLEFYKKSAKLDALVGPVMEILSGAAIGGVVWYGGLLITEGRTSPGALFAFVTAFVAAYRPFKSLVSLNINLQEGLAAAKRVFHILDIKSKIIDNIDAIDADFTNTDISFKDVELKFDKKVALRSVNLKLQQGKTTAIVGRSGGGKTSITNLLVRFYDLTKGSIQIGGIDINNYTLKCLRNQIGYITQDVMLFDTSVYENIAYGNPGTTNEDIIKAAKDADADEFIVHLPEGYNTIIGAQGSTLSGGQRQRISIARALLKNAKILILDEATSALDLGTEQSILSTLKRLNHERTTIIITHRLTSIIDVDEIVVMKNGKVAEIGSHTKLMSAKNEYYELYHKELEEKSYTM